MIPPVASRFVAGETTAEALDHAARCNERDVGVILNLLGEHYGTPEPAAADRETYRELIADIDRSGLRACISVKPSQIGLDLGEDTFRENLGLIADDAAEAGVFLWIDMEDHTTTDATLDAYEDLAREHDGGVGVCVQANLKRTREDVERLAEVPGKVRFVKGAYDEPESVAYTRKDRVDAEYRELLTYAFEEYDGGIAVGSHDPAMIDHATGLHEEFGTDFEIQMLMGVREDAQTDLAADHEVWQYVPYGRKWKSYFYRRMVERKENVTFALRAILGR